MAAPSKSLISVSDARQTRPWPRPFNAYVLVHGLWLALYVLLGKGFAYAGFPPFYVGELLLVFAGVILLCSRRLTSISTTPIGVVATVFIGWQLWCSVPYVTIYGFDALRDSVIWAYCLFAWAAAALILRLPGLVRITTLQFGRFGRWFLILGPIAWLSTTYLSDSLPHWPGTTVSIPLVKGDEYCVHLAGVLALVLQGIGPVRQGWVLLILADALLAMNVRSGLLAFVVAATFAVLLRPRPERLLVVVTCTATLISAMAVFDFKVKVPGKDREFSVGQLMDNLQSVVGNTSRSDLDATRRWRLIWWQEIVDYTFDGPYFWTGKGYGVNLADSDGFQVGTRDEPLRSPHSSHLTFLARSGVPGFVSWIALQLTWVASMLKSYVQARRREAKIWVGIFAWLTAYWLAFMVAAGFDVFLEGPMAGIPFWTIFGIGWGAHILFQSQLRRPSVMVQRLQTRPVRLAYASE